MRRRRYDVVVIGAGTAGLVAATRLAQAGAGVCVVARGFGSTHLAAGTIDVLGYAPERVERPLDGLSRLIAAQPEHPYSRIGSGAVSAALEWFATTVASGVLPGYAYVGGIERNLLLPTALGVLKPSALVPASFAAGHAHALRRVAVAGITALRDFHAGLCAENLRAAGLDAHPVTLALELDRADTGTLGLARRLDDAQWRASFCARLAPLVEGFDQVGLPAILGLREPHAVWRDCEQRLGCAVFEIPALPPSVPGMRLFELLAGALRAAGGTVAIGAGVVGHRRDGGRAGGRVLSVQADTAGSPTSYEADAFVLASGGVHSGAIALDSHWQAHELVLGLPLAGLPGPGEPRFAPGYFDEQPFARVGVAVDERLRALGASNVVVAGASLPGAVPWREGSGEGIALASGYHAAAVLAAELGAGVAA